jgi:hypothetical protein
MKRKRIYVETSIFSYLAARPSRDLVVSAWQEVTREFWDQHREAYDLVTSQLVVEECSEGNSDAVERRLELLRGMPELAVDDAAKVVAAALLSKGGVPRKAEFDALHIAAAAVGGADYLLTWNCRHLNNPVTKPRVRTICEQCGHTCPEICTPFELTEGDLR